jgi:hypothetical protein
MTPCSITKRGNAHPSPYPGRDSSTAHALPWPKGPLDDTSPGCDFRPSAGQKLLACRQVRRGARAHPYRRRPLRARHSGMVKAPGPPARRKLCTGHGVICVQNPTLWGRPAVDAVAYLPRRYRMRRGAVSGSAAVSLDVLPLPAADAPSTTSSPVCSATRPMVRVLPTSLA